ncbi:MAG TPA: DUF1206 domain-containing protein [Miltoncostaeaceae bacterium]|nr:DUF1206 domain-containing protein [Miltoncostaeaceae bacterium]
MGSGGAAARVDRVADRRDARAVARAGMVAHGVPYALIGVLALGVALGVGGRVTDQEGAFRTVAQNGLGRVLLAAVAAGLLAYALWRFVQAWADREHDGDDAKGTLARLANVARGLVAVAFAVLALRLVIGAGGGGGTEPRTATAGVFGWTGGRALVLVAAAVVLGIGVWQVVKGVRRSFMEGMRVRGTARPLVERLGLVGHVARGAVMGLVALFLAKAAIEFDASEAVGLDGALARLVREPYGRPMLGLVAAGLIAFALYCAAEARYREP